MSVIIRLQNLAWTASSRDVRQFFQGLKIPDGGVHIVGGDDGDAFIAFSSDEDARQAMMMTGKEIHNKPVSLLLSSKVEMSKVISDARDRLASASPSPSPQPPPLELPTWNDSPDYQAAAPARDSPSPPQRESQPSENAQPMQNFFTHFLLGKRSPSREREEPSKVAKKGPREYSTSAWTDDSPEESPEEKVSSVPTPSDGPTPSNDTFIMAKAEEALKALQMMGVIPSFYTQDSTEVTASLSKDSRMSTVANEDPQESANRLVPKSLAVTTATGSRSGESLNMDRFLDNRQNSTPSYSLDRFQENKSWFIENKDESRWSSSRISNEDGRWEKEAEVDSKDLSFSLSQQQQQQQQQPDWSCPPPPTPPEIGSWNVPPEDDDDIDNGPDTDLPFGMHHFSAGVNSRRFESSATNRDSNRNTNTPSNDLKPPSTIPAPPLVLNADNGGRNEGLQQGYASDDMPGQAGGNGGGVWDNNRQPGNVSHNESRNAGRGDGGHDRFGGGGGAGGGGGYNFNQFNLGNDVPPNDQMPPNFRSNDFARNSSNTHNSQIGNDFQGNNFQGNNFVPNDNVGSNQIAPNFQGNNSARSGNVNDNTPPNLERDNYFRNSQMGQSFRGNDFARNNIGINEMAQNFYGDNRTTQNFHGRGDNSLNDNHTSRVNDGPRSFEDYQTFWNAPRVEERSNDGRPRNAWPRNDSGNECGGDMDRSNDGSMNHSTSGSHNDGNLSSDFGRETASTTNEVPDTRRTASNFNFSDGRPTNSDSDFPDDGRRAASGFSDFSPSKSSYKDSALPIDALLPPPKSNPFDVLFEKPYQPTSRSNLSTSSAKGRDDGRGSSDLHRASSFIAPSKPADKQLPRDQSKDHANNAGVGLAGNEATSNQSTGNSPRQQFFVALVNMDWNVDFQGVTEFLLPAREGSRGTYPCYGARGKLNGNFVIQLDTEEDLRTVLSKDGSFWSNRKVFTFRILEKQFSEVEWAFKNQKPFLRIERPPASAFDAPFAPQPQKIQQQQQKHQQQPSKDNSVSVSINSDAISKDGGRGSNFGHEDIGKQAETQTAQETSLQDISGSLSISISPEKDLRTTAKTETETATSPSSKMIYEHRKSEPASTGKTVFEYNNGEASLSPVASKPSTTDDEGSRRRKNSGGSVSSLKLFESRNDVEKRISASAFDLHRDGSSDDRFRLHDEFEEKSRKIIGDYPGARPLMELSPSSTSTSQDVDQRKPPLPPNIRSKLLDPPAFSTKPGILGSPPVHRSSPVAGIRWIGVVKNPVSDISRKEVRQILGDVRTIDEGIHVLHPRKMFPDELIFLEFDNQESLYEGLELMRHVQRVVGRETRVFRVAQRQYLDCVAAYERGSRFSVEPPPTPALQHFFVHVRNAPSNANGNDLAAILSPVVTVDIHRMAMSPASPVSSFVVEVVGRSDLTAVLSLDKQRVDQRHQLCIFRMARYQYEDAVASARKRSFVTVKPPSNSELDADDRWYAEYIEKYEPEMRTFAFDFRPKTRRSGGELAITSNSSRRNSPGGDNMADIRGRTPPFAKKDQRSDNRDRSSSKGKDAAYKPRSRSPSKSKENGDKNWRDGKRDSDMRRGRGGGGGGDRSGRNRDNSRERDRKTDDDKFAERKKGGKNNVDVVVIDDDDPSKPVKANSSGKYGLQISGLDSRVPQSRINAFFSEMGVKLSNLRIVVRPGAPMAVAFVETTDYSVYKKAFEYEGHLLDGKFPIHVENVAVSSISKRFVDIRKGLWFPKLDAVAESSTSAPSTKTSTATSTASSTVSRQQASVSGVVRPLMGNSKDAPASEVKKPVAVVTPGNRAVSTPPDLISSSGCPSVQSPASTSSFATGSASTSLTAATFTSVSTSSTPAQSSSAQATSASSSSTPAQSSSAQATSASSSSTPFDAMSFIERNLASRPASSGASPSTSSSGSFHRLRIESAPVDVTSGDVEEFFSRRRLTSDRIDIRRDVKETPGGLIGKVDVVVAFKRLQDREEAMKMTAEKLKGVAVGLRREGSDAGSTEITGNSPSVGNPA